MNEEEIIKYINQALNDLRPEITLTQAIQGLLDLYNKQKEKNKELEKTILEFVNDRERILKTPVISKDKIREKIKEYQNRNLHFVGITDLQELLEERN